MPQHSEFVDYLLELLTPLGGVRAQRMFGGYGIYRDGLMFGLVANEVLYLKTDESSRAAFEARGLPPFTYQRSGKPAIVMSYHRAPEDALEESETLCRWARDASAAALLSANKQKRPEIRVIGSFVLVFRMPDGW
ncbi:MAG: TfoX/Sxy family protein [Nevskiales bacterium]